MGRDALARNLEGALARDLDQQSAQHQSEWQRLEAELASKTAENAKLVEAAERATLLLVLYEKDVAEQDMHGRELSDHLNESQNRHLSQRDSSHWLHHLLVHP